MSLDHPHDPFQQTILFVCDFNGHGGTQTHLLSLFETIDRHRYRPRLATPNLHPDLAARLRGIDVDVSDLRLSGALRFHTAGAIRALAEDCTRHGVDLIHGYLFAGNAIAAALSVLTGIPCVTSVRNVDLTRKGLHLVVSAAAHRAARHVLFNSSAVMRLVARRERIDMSKCSIILNSVADMPHHGKAPASPGTPGIPVGPARPILVCVASLRPKKGHRDLFAAFAIVRRRIPTATLLLVGDGPDRGMLQQEAARVCPTGSVIFEGYRSDVAPILAGGDLFVLASLEEGMPNALLEAMAAGLPAVVTDVGGNAEAIENGTTGYLVPASDPAAMAGRMIEILSDPALRERQSTAARRRYETTFTLDRMTRAYHALYDRLLARTAG